MMDLSIGQQVTLTKEAIPYGGRDRAGKPFVVIPAGAVGIIGAVDVPPVVGNRGNFMCVDVPAKQCRIDRRWNLRHFEVAAIERQKTWRCAVRKGDIA